MHKREEYTKIKIENFIFSKSGVTLQNTQKLSTHHAHQNLPETRTMESSSIVYLKIIKKSRIKGEHDARRLMNVYATKTKDSICGGRKILVKYSANFVVSTRARK